jgi:probable F420-dependent oxidoreductase
MVLSENWTLQPTPTVADLVELAVAAEAAGVDGVMMSDHVVLGPSSGSEGLPFNLRDYAYPGNQDPDSPWPSPYMVLAAIASRTQRLRLVVGALIAPLRNPLVSAKDLATLDQLSHGRLVVLPTVSWHEEEFAAVGVSFNKRGAIMDEQLQIWQRAWRDAPMEFHGEYFSIDPVWCSPRPYREGGPELWFGGSSLHGAVVRRLVAYGSGFNPLGQPLADELDVLKSAMTDAGRSMDEIEMVGGLRGHFDSPDTLASLDDAIAALADQVASGYTTFCFKPSMYTDDANEVPEICRRVVAALATLSEVLDNNRLRPYG